ncbi:MAG: hypothetical protein ACYDCK_09920 [Thermoplasmatota archaeon]
MGGAKHLPLPYRAGKWILDEGGVTPIIGTILILAISIVGTAAVLYWGLPAIDEMKANVEQKTIQNQFNELDSDIKELVAGTAGKTAKRWEPTIDRGDFIMEQGTQRWLISMDKQRASGHYNFTYGNLTSGATSTVVRICNLGDTIGGAANGTVVKAYKVAGSLFTQLNTTIVAKSGVYKGMAAQMDTTSMVHSWAGGQASATCPTTDSRAQYFRITTRNVTGTNQNITLTNAALKLEIWDGPTLASEAWLFDLGQAHWILRGSQSSREMFETMGTVVSGANNAYAVTNTPTLPPPKTTGGTYRFFAREVQLNGSASFAGSNHFDVLVDLYDTSSLEDQSCLSTDKTTCAKDVRVYLEGSLASTWSSYFMGSSNGYSFRNPANEFPAGTSGDPTTYLLDWKPNGMAFTLLHSVVTLTG